MCPVPDSALAALRGVPESSRVRTCPMREEGWSHYRFPFSNVHFGETPAVERIVGYEWFAVRPAEGVSRRVKRSWWWLAKKVKNMPEEMRTGNIRKDDSRMLGLFRKFRLGSLLQVQRLRGREWRTVGPTSRDEMIKILRRLPVRRERWKRRRRR